MFGEQTFAQLRTGFRPAQIKPKSFESRKDSFFLLLLFLLFLTRDGCASCLRACLGARLLPQSYQYPNLSKGADRVGGQLRGDKECPFSGVTSSGRVWRKVPERDARSVLEPGKFIQETSSSVLASLPLVTVASCTGEPLFDSSVSSAYG